MAAQEKHNGGAEVTDDSVLDDPQDQPGINYEVGYRKPPKTRQFKKGVSGNPKGRTKSKRIDDIRELADGVLDETIRVKDGNQVRTVSSLEAAISAYLREALSGNPTAARNLFKLAAKAGMLSKVSPQSFVKLMEPGGDDGKVIRMLRVEQEELARARQNANGNTHEVSALLGARRGNELQD